MTSSDTNLNSGLALPPASLSTRTTVRTARRWFDSAATVIVTLGGLATILSILGIFLYLFIEVVPLFYSASASESSTLIVQSDSAVGKLPQQIGVGLDEYMEIGYVIDAGKLLFFHLASGKPVPLEMSIPVGEVAITAVGRSGAKDHIFALGTSDGRIIPLTIDFNVSFLDGVRTIQPQILQGDPIEFESDIGSIQKLAYRETTEGRMIAAVVTKANQILLLKVIEEEEGLFTSEVEQTVSQGPLGLEASYIPSAFLLDELGEMLIIGTRDGKLLYWDIRNIEMPRLMGTYQVSTVPEEAVTALSYLIGERSLVVGTSQGGVTAWMPYVDPDKGGDPRLTEMRAFLRHSGEVTVISPSQRDKGFITGDSTGEVSLHYLTSGQTLARIPGSGVAINGIMFSPKGDGAIVNNRAGQLTTYTIDNEHPETTMASIFTPVLYEGYDQPRHIWQSSSGSDDFEPKFGLWPLIFGTFKGTLYAMLLATPLAVLGAIYTAMFMHPDIRSVVKPVVEIMAALPTVVLGFLAGLWFAPLLENIFPSVVGLFFVLPVALAGMCVVWQVIPAWIRREPGSLTEFLVFSLVILGSIGLCLSFNSQFENWFFNSNYKQWLLDTFGLEYDQRNAMVIAFAMGMAVIPTIFSISEDSISNVPRHLIAGSLALGATPWQTLTKLVIISASPGLFSALMIGLGRVVGETMIVLMATGNTPVMDMNLFNGFRTLSANIAVEMPEAPEGGTLFRLLFLAGLILFAFTSIVNTIAEVVRQRLRAKYSQF